MHSLAFTAESAANGVLTRDFTLGDIPGVLWSPAASPASVLPAPSAPSAPSAPPASPASSASPAPSPAPLVLLGHGGGTHKKHRAMTGRAHRLVTGSGFHVAVLDAPGHGDRPRGERDERDIAALREAQAAGAPEGPVVVPYNARLAEIAVPEYRSLLDALLELP
ncbi:hypothetical protein GA0115252_11838 [Streptomyces sp. DfronAA-171]|nr:hypothetical protein GA0115252_11838 [Streptomyces sp. DfronAA-171]